MALWAISLFLSFDNSTTQFRCFSSRQLLLQRLVFSGSYFVAVFSNNGVELHFEIRGNGPRLVFHPGTLSDLRVAPTIFDSPLANQFEILTFDPVASASLIRRSTPPIWPIMLWTLNA